MLDGLIQADIDSRAKMKKWCVSATSFVITSARLTSRFEKWAAEKAKRAAAGLPVVVEYRDLNYVGVFRPAVPSRADSFQW